MGIYPAPEKCYITGARTINHPSSIDCIDYSIDYHGRRYSFTYYSRTDWESIISGEKKHILHCLIHNDLWPFNGKVTIKKDFIDTIIKLAEYPGNFDEKVIFCLKKLYRDGGDVYKKIPINNRDYLCAFALDRDEYERIIRALESRNYIALTGTNVKDFAELTEEGRIIAKEAIEKECGLSKIRFDTENKPSVLICYSNKCNVDKEYSKILNEELLKNDFTVNFYPENYTEKILDTQVQNIQNGKVDFVVLIQSYLFNTDMTLKKLLTTIIEKAEELHGISHFCVIAKIDDSNVLEADHRLNGFPIFDVRFNNVRKKLILSIAKSWIETSKNSLNLNSASEMIFEEYLREIVNKRADDADFFLDILIDQGIIRLKKEKARDYFINWFKNNKEIDLQIENGDFAIKDGDFKFVPDFDKSDILSFIKWFENEKSQFLDYLETNGIDIHNRKVNYKTVIKNSKNVTVNNSSVVNNQSINGYKSNTRKTSIIFTFIGIVLTVIVIFFGDNLIERHFTLTDQEDIDSLVIEKNRIIATDSFQLPYLENVPIFDKGLFVKYNFNDLNIGGINIDTISANARAKDGSVLIFEKSDSLLILDITKEPYIELEYKGEYYSVEITGAHNSFKCIIRENIEPTMKLKKYIVI